MRKAGVGHLSGTTLVVMACLAWVCTYCNTVRAGDSCISCHTDEAMLTQYLGTDEKRKSALQAGPG